MLFVVGTVHRLLNHARALSLKPPARIVGPWTGGFSLRVWDLGFRAEGYEGQNASYQV